MARCSLAVVSAVLVSVCFAGCGESDPNKPAYWLERLQTAERTSAIMRLGEMKASEAVDPLIQEFKDGRDRYEIVAALAQIGDKKAIPSLVEAVKNHEDAKTARLAASTLKEWGAKDHLADYLTVAVNPKAQREARYGALELVAEFADPSVIQPLLPVLKADPDVQPIVFNGLAAEALGKVKAEAAVGGLINCLWMDDHLGRNEVPKCRLALNRIGPEKVIPELIKTLERKNRDVEARARKLSFDQNGLIEAKAAELIGDMPSAEAVDALVKALQLSAEMPPRVQRDPKQAQAFVMGHVQRIISVANALAVIGDDRGVEPLVAIAASKERPLEEKLAATQQLAFLGSQAAVPGLMKILKDEPHPRDPVSQGFRLQIALALGNLLDGSDKKALDRFESQVNDIVKNMTRYQTGIESDIAKADKKTAGGLKRDLKAYQKWIGDYGKALKKLAAVRECAGDALCWGKKLSSEDEADYMVAAYQLSQMKGARDTALQQLLTQAGTENLGLRNAVFFGLHRLGDHSILPKLEEIRKADAERAAKKKEFKGAVYTTDLMIAKLSHVK